MEQNEPQSDSTLSRPVATETKPRLAVIDIGSNSIRLMVVEVRGPGHYRVLEEEKVAARLGQGLSKTGRLDSEMMNKAMIGLKRMREIAEGFQVARLKAIATSAVREATNGPDFCRRVRDVCGLEIDVISAKEEGLLAFSSVKNAFDLGDQPVAIADIGGGSTEIVLAVGNLVEAVYATQLGAVRLTEMFGNGADMAGAGFMRLVEHIDQHLRQHAREPMIVPHVLFGSGGTFTNLAGIVMVAKGQFGVPIRGYQVSRADVRHVVDRVRRLPLKERENVPGMDSKRADIIVAGLAVVDRLMHYFGINLVQTHNRGVRDGLILSLIDEFYPAERSQNSSGSAVDRRDQAIERLATACGVEMQHAKHVASLACSIFRQLAPDFSMDVADEVLLDVAARLEDVGYLIDYEEHHKHSYQLILNSRLEGFQPAELELIANIARYHRGSDPKPKHENFAQLSPGDQQRVERLSAILRVAGGLDRTNTQQVETVTVKRTATDIQIVVQAPADPDVDLWGAQRRASLFEKAFNTKLEIAWANRPNATRRSEAPSTETVDQPSAKE